MRELRQRFGSLVAAHRKRRGMTQRALAEAADLSDDMISRIEVGGTGASFPAISRLAAALDVDPAQLFMTDEMRHLPPRPALADLTGALAGLSDADLTWASELLTAALKGRR